MLSADVLTFNEFAMHETLPLSDIHRAILEFLQGRRDVVLFGAQAVNAYVGEPRMTQDVDLMSIRAAAFSEELRSHLNAKFNIAVRIREVGDGRGFRIFQLRKEGNRHLADIRSVENLPESNLIEDVSVLNPVDLIGSKLVSYQARRGRPKSGTDWRDLALLLLAFPNLRSEIPDWIAKHGLSETVSRTWEELNATNFELENEDDEFLF